MVSLLRRSTRRLSARSPLRHDHRGDVVNMSLQVGVGDRNLRIPTRTLGVKVLTTKEAR
jgi:hypothetical protein